MERQLEWIVWRGQCGAAREVCGEERVEKQTWVAECQEDRADGRDTLRCKGMMTGCEAGMRNSPKTCELWCEAPTRKHC